MKYILTLLLLWTGQLFAQEVKFTASVSKSTVGTGEQFEVTFSVNSDGSSFTPPDMSQFQLLSGPNTSTNMEFINGKATMSSSFSYILAATTEGPATIGPAYIVVNNRRYATTPIKMTIVKGRPMPQNNRNRNSGGGGGEEGPAVGDLSKSLFIRAIIDKDNVYQGQPLTVTYKIFTRVDIMQSQVNKLPDLTGFWNQDVPATQPAQFKLDIYKGVRYNVAEIKQIVLFPEHAGNITIDPFEMTFIARVQVPTQDPMEQFFGRNIKDVNVKVKSLPVVVHVKPLPIEGRPDGFTGAVGKFSIDANIDRNKLKANESFNYKVKVTGSGNIKLLKNVNAIFPADFEKYDPKIVDTVNGVTGSRVYNYLVIPRHQGDYTIDPIKFSYFNPNTGKYVSLTTRSFKVKVDKGLAENNVTALAGADKQDVKLREKDIRYIKTGDPDLQEEGDEFFGSAGYYLLLFLSPLLAGVAFVYRNKVRKDNSDVVRVKSRRAGKEAAKHLANAQKELTANNTQAFYEAISKGIYGYLSNKLNINYADLNRETIADTLKARNVNDALIAQLLDTLDLCEMARYAPVTHISQQEVFDKAKNTINAIENEI